MAINLPENYASSQHNRVIKLLNYVTYIEDNFFKTEEVKNLTEKQIYERYNLAKDTLFKEIDLANKIYKSDDNLDPTTKNIIAVILNLSPDEKLGLKEKLLEIKRGQ
jgi:hypothetical protein